MSNIQRFQSLFDVSFPQDTAEMILDLLQANYGKAFDDKFGQIDSSRMITTVQFTMSGVDQDDLRRGLERMKSEKWCPSIPEFRTWCDQGSDWWTAEQAWAKALNFRGDDSEPITTIAKRCLDEVGHILKTEGQKSAHRAFVDIYTDYLAKAKQHGRTQVMHVVPHKPAQIEQDENRKGIACPPELAAKIRGAYRGPRA